jgi:hypothetical protein
MLPTIRRHASLAFRDMDSESRQELVQEVVCNALVAYKRLFDQGRVELAYPTVLARFGICQAVDGRRVGSKRNVRDVLSEYAQRQKGFQVDRLDRFDREEGQWLEVLVEDRHAGPAEVACCRLDFRAWLRSLPGRLRKVAEVLASGETTGGAAERFGVSAGRISQMRRELATAWAAFQGAALEVAPGPA